MLRLPTGRAIPGIQLAVPVMHPQKPGHILLKPGATLDSNSIRRLSEFRIPFVWVRYPATESLLNIVSPRIMEAHAELTRRLSDGLDSVARNMHASFDFRQYAGVVRSLANRLVEDQKAAVFINEVLSSDRPDVAHASNVCLLSLLMGMKLDAYLVKERAVTVGVRRAQNIENLGVGAMLHDVGMLRLPPDALKRLGPDPDENDPVFQRHTALGFEMVRGKIGATAAAAILHHHQRCDGSGFPARPRADGTLRPLAGSEIHIFARIVAVADVFDRLRNAGHTSIDGSPHPEPNVRTLHRMLPMARTGKLDPVIFKALLAVVPAYTPGSLVLLSNGQECVVTGWDPTNPCRPTVSPVLERSASWDEPDTLGPPMDLADRPTVWITHSDGVNVEDANFRPTTYGEFDLRTPGPSVDAFKPGRPSLDELQALGHRT